MNRLMNVISICSLFLLSFSCTEVTNEPIDREAVVKRHRVFTTGTLLKSPAQVGNGKFAFGMDITGLQTFAAFNTLSDWGWHSYPLPDGLKIEDYQPQVYESYGKKISYIDSDPNHPEITAYLARNPHRFNLGRIAFRLLREDGSEARELDLKSTRQEIDLWTGIVDSRFELNRSEVKVRTVCHPEKDMIAVQVKSDLLKKGKIAVYLDFPYADKLQFPHFMGRYDETKAHISSMEQLSANSIRIDRKMDDTQYFVNLDWNGPATFKRESEKNHRFILHPGDTETIYFTCCFSEEKA
ncbi:MAG: hypothetical protein Q4A54_05590, partial [Parabacteroides sp.]|nr:hypothetical protein [Parabacteroides sp.]